MTLNKRSFAGATIDLSAPTLTLRLGRAWGAWKEVKYIVSRFCRAQQRCREPHPRMRTFRVTRSFQGLLGQFVILEMSIPELSEYIKNSTSDDQRIRPSFKSFSLFLVSQNEKFNFGAR